MAAAILSSLGLHWPWFCLMFILIQSENLTFAFKGSFPSNKIQSFHQKLCLASDLPVWLSGPETDYPMHLFLCMSTTKSLLLTDNVGVTDHIGKKCIHEYFCSSSKYRYFNLFPPPSWRARTWPLRILLSLFFTFIDNRGIPVWTT